MPRKKNKDSHHYVDNKQLFEAMKEFKQECAEAEEEGEEQPPISNYIGSCIMKIAEHLATKPNFSNYTYKDEMISDGIENCVKYAANFDPEKSKNPFSYFTQIIWYAFIRRIKKEKRQAEMKYKFFEKYTNPDVFNRLAAEGRNPEKEFMKYLQLSEDDVKKKKKKKKKSSDSSLESIME